MMRKRIKMIRVKEMILRLLRRKHAGMLQVVKVSSNKSKQMALTTALKGARTRHKFICVSSMK